LNVVRQEGQEIGYFPTQKEKRGRALLDSKEDNKETQDDANCATEDLV
jgi:hypothetical protein